MTASPGSPARRSSSIVHVHRRAAVDGEGVCTHEHVAHGTRRHRRDASREKRLHGPVALLSHSFIKRRREGLTVARRCPRDGRSSAAPASGSRSSTTSGSATSCSPRNHRTRAGELDLIVADGRTIVFVEVKTRSAGGLDPLLAITAQKRRRIRGLAAAWLAEHPGHPRRGELRFDAVAVVLDQSGGLVALEQLESIA
jgi:Holliday junction resolvase-like predicted endonuclease